MTLTHSDRRSWMKTIWDALDKIDNTYTPPEVWDDICTAMAWIAEELGEDASDDFSSPTPKLPT